MGAPRASTREHRHPNMYKALVTGVIDREPSKYYEDAHH